MDEKREMKRSNAWDGQAQRRNENGKGNNREGWAGEEKLSRVGKEEKLQGGQKGND